MTAALLLPAAAVVVSVMVLGVLSLRVTKELTELRRSLRHVGAIAVAGDELSRAVDRLADQITSLRNDALFRVLRSRGASGDPREPIDG